MMPFLTRLEHELDGACELVLPCAQHLGSTHQHRDMRIVPAGMHRACRFGSVIETGILVQRQRIHIAAEKHGAAVAGAFEGGDQAGGRGTLAELQRKPSERRLDLGERLRILQPKLRLAVDIAAQRNQVGEDFGGVIAPRGVGKGHCPNLALSQAVSTPLPQAGGGLMITRPIAPSQIALAHRGV
jgi:hypothetical protein